MELSNIKKGFIDFLTFPFRKELTFFIVAFLISATVDLVVYSYTASIFKALFIGLHHYVICYLLTLILYFLPAWCKSIYKIIISILTSISFIIDFVCIYSFHSVFSEHFTSIFANTNLNETIEFFRTYISTIHILVFFSFISLICFFYNWMLKRKKIFLNEHNSIIGVICVILAIVSISAISTKNIGNISIVKFYSLFKDTPPDLKSYMTNPDLVIKDIDRPKNIVVIIGESFAKSHSSLYSYEKITNPGLSSLRESGSLYVYNNVVSPAVNTIPAFKCIMSTYKPEYKDSVDWFKCTKMHEIIHKIGYDTYWFSNQNKNGLWDNVVTQYAMLSHHVYFNGEKFAVKNKEDLDGDLIPLIKEKGNLKNYKDNKFYFIHLMGSHYDFDKRYPKNRDKFKPEDYVDKDENQRSLLAKYDNSIVYNDSVVCNLIKLFDNEETIIFYFPDHGLDVYESREDYIGHAIYDNSESVKAGSAIPFMIYMNQSFQKKYPVLKERVSQNINTQFRTDDFIYTIMDIMGVQFPFNDDVENFSLLH